MEDMPREGRLEIRCKGRDSQYEEVLNKAIKATIHFNILDGTENTTILMHVLCLHHVGGQCMVTREGKKIFCPYSGNIPDKIDNSNRKIRGIEEIIR